ncbi:MAG: YfhO family protein, partial [Lachnospiraceae bacterium]|nr:YfhO family protein [Candidatus Equihabitans merdae]
VDAMYQNYQGVSTYNSVQNGNIQELVDSDWTQIRYLDQNHISFRKGPGNMPENELAGIRYVLAESDCLILGDYKVWKQVGHIYIYKNDTIDGICSYYDENDVTVVDQDEIKVKQSKLDQEADLDFNKQLRDDRVDGKVTASEDGYLIIAYPFESGWKAYVDGQEVETFKANKAYQAVKLSAGTHEVALRFYCPLVRESLIVTLVSLLIFAGTWVYSARKRRTACKSSTK